MATTIVAPEGAVSPEQGITIEDADIAMMDVLTLIHAAADLNESGGCLSDIEPLITGPKSRITALLIMARDKTAEAIRALEANHG